MVIDEISEIFDRANIHHFRGFLLDEYKFEFQEEDKPFHERLEESKKAIYKRLKNLYPNPKEEDDAFGDLYLALSTYRDVYMEIGMKVGAQLVHQLLAPHKKI